MSEPTTAEPAVADKARPSPPPDNTRANLLTIVGAVAVALIIRGCLFEAFEIDGPSMEPTLLHGDRVAVEKYAFGFFLPWTHEALFTWGIPDRGDVVIVDSPADDVIIVKRVIGIPGDTIRIRDDVVYVNGESILQRAGITCMRDGQADSPDCEWTEEHLDEHTYRTSHSRLSATDSMAESVVPPGHIFVLGDHRDRSNDSRRIGMIPASRVKGRALAIYWSYHGHLRWDRMFEAVD